ncbi:hypothetical protein DPMN_049549 [Dreissena polymorpha]|uniref:Uncharacterized protein n=1 Tax=Dreissena polymorpha TaxID=45954 RepID=A0A9D4CG43_DREPO|nr:hypothetical protein DPMN_049549 [Dreissena polymorpha]
MESTQFAHLRGFHDDWAKNVNSRKNTPPTGGHVFLPIWTIFELVPDINKTNVLTNFHDYWANIVTSRVFTRENCHYIHIKKNAPPTGGHVFSPIWTIVELVRDINKTNVLTNFRDDWAKFHVIELTGTIFKLYSHIKETNVLTKFHENWAKNVTSRVFTCFHNIHIEKNASPTGGHVFSPIWTIFELIRDINNTNCFSQIRKTAPPTGGHVCQRTGTTFELNQHIIKTNILTNFELNRDFIGTKLLTKFHEDRTINVASRVFTNKCGRTNERTYDGQRPVTKAHLSNQFHDPRRLTETIFELNSRIKETNVLTKFHENWAKNVTPRVLTCFHYIHIEENAPPTGGHVFSLIRTIVELVPDINKTNVLTNFHDDWAKIVTSRVFTRENCHYIHIKKNAPPTGGHVFSPIWTIFELVPDINKTNPNRENCHYIHIEKNAPPTGAHVFHRSGPFSNSSDISIESMFLPPFMMIGQKLKTTPPTGGHVFHQTGTTFELNQDIIKTNILTK